MDHAGTLHCLSKQAYAHMRQHSVSPSWMLFVAYCFVQSLRYATKTFKLLGFEHMSITQLVLYQSILRSHHRWASAAACCSRALGKNPDLFQRGLLYLAQADIAKRSRRLFVRMKTGEKYSSDFIEKRLHEVVEIARKLAPTHPRQAERLLLDAAALIPGKKRGGVFTAKALTEEAQALLKQKEPCAESHTKLWA